MSAELSDQPVSLTVEARAHGWRIDHYLSRLFSNYSRALLQRAIEQRGVTVNGLPVKTSKRLRVNDIISVQLPTLPDRNLPAEDIPLDVLYEDDVLVVLNKAAGMIVHPGRGHYHGTLVGALQFHFDQLSNVAGQLRPGIVHRLDRDTSGLLIVAKDNAVHHKLSAQFERREVQKEYIAVAHGVIDRDSDYIETFMGVHPTQREKMCVCPPGGAAREAVTFYEVVERFAAATYVRLRPKTGRTHQLRVHLRHLGHPIVADRVYGGHVPIAAPSAAEPGGADDLEAPEEAEVLTPLSEPTGPIARQALHAHRLQFTHPVTGRPLDFTAPIPADIAQLLAGLRAGTVTL